MAQGFDSAAAISTTSRVNLVLNNGGTFVGRYLNVLTNYHEGLTSSEVTRISDAGLYIVSLYETNSNTSPPSFSSSLGTTEANNAIALAENLGQPNNTPIYFCIDCNPTQSQLTSYIVPYFQSIKTVLASATLNPNGYKMGIYGSKLVCSYIRGTYSATERYTYIVDKNWYDSNPSFTDWNLRQYKWNYALSTSDPTFLVNYVESSSYGGGGWKR